MNTQDRLKRMVDAHVSNRQRAGIKSYYVSSKHATVQVDVNQDGVVIAVPPIYQKFLGSQFTGLIKWIAKVDGNVNPTVKELVITK